MRQKQALAVMMGGGNVFLTGAPGAGKTYVLNQFVRRAQAAGKRVAVTASTGIAASHLGGTTIHSWSGLGILDELNKDDIKRLGGSDKLINRYNSTDVLVIDEVSMLHGYRLDMINRLAKQLRGSDQAFGGMQVVLVGDLYQLPPVSRQTTLADFAHTSTSWQELNLQVCYLTEQYRQQSNDGLLELLEAMRGESVDEYHAERLQGRLGEKPADKDVVTRLFAHNVDVDSINQRHLAALPGRSHWFEMQTKGAKVKLEQLTKSLLVPTSLELKIGAEVMFVANNFAEGFVNGSRGRVIGFENALPTVRLMNSRVIHVEPHGWSLNEDGRVRAEVSQLPLRLAWAITIHKSQGMSLDAAEIDLSKAFTPGMGYVALSRVRSLDGLYLKGLNAMAMTMHPHMEGFDNDLRARSRELAQVTDDIGDAMAQVDKSVVIIPDSELFKDLKRWRLERAHRDGIAPFMVAHNAALTAVAGTKPLTSQQLLGISGFGPRKVESYGADIIDIVSQHL